MKHIVTTTHDVDLFDHIPEGPDLFEGFAMDDDDPIAWPGDTDTYTPTPLEQRLGRPADYAA